ncbi:MAG: hypothetical protein ACK57P_08415, partial [Planctomycetota bacterium]
KRSHRARANHNATYREVPKRLQETTLDYGRLMACPLLRTVPSLPPNACDQRLATKGLSMPTDFIASPLHRFVLQLWLSCGRLSRAETRGEALEFETFHFAIRQPT